MHKQLHGIDTEVGAAIYAGMLPGSIIVGKLDLTIFVAAIHAA